MAKIVQAHKILILLRLLKSGIDKKRHLLCQGAGLAGHCVNSMGFSSGQSCLFGVLWRDDGELKL